MLPVLDPASTVSPADFAGGLSLSDDARALVPGAPTLHSLLLALVEAKLHGDAARLLVRGLPRRYAVAWVCDCFRRDAEIQPLSAADADCLRCAEAWIAEDTDTNRRVALQQAEANRFETPGSWLAAAAAWSGGSLAPPGYATVVPAEHLSGDACYAALCLLAARASPALYKGRLGAWVERAVAVFLQGATTDGGAAIK